MEVVVEGEVGAVLSSRGVGHLGDRTVVGHVDEKLAGGLGGGGR